MDITLLLDQNLAARQKESLTKSYGENEAEKIMAEVQGCLNITEIYLRATIPGWKLQPEAAKRLQGYTFEKIRQWYETYGSLNRIRKNGAEKYSEEFLKHYNPDYIAQFVQNVD